MSLISKIYKHFIIGSIKDTEAIPDVSEWMRFLSDLPEPEDAVERSYNKYRCRKWYISKYKLVLLNIAAFVRLVAALPNLIASKGSLPENEHDLLVVLRALDVDPDDVVPAMLLERFSRSIVVDRPTFRIGMICKEAAALYHDCVKRHPLSFYYQLLVLKELSLHTALLMRYNAKAVAVYVEERNLASPILTKLYEDSGRELDSFMHGEYQLQMIQAFMAFSNYYVWSDAYEEMFKKDLRCSFGGCHAYVPKKYSKIKCNSSSCTTRFCTYYFSGESERSVQKLAELYRELAKQGLRCVVRPHPRYSHNDLIAKVFSGEQIENPKKVRIETSLSESEYVIGLASTVLREAEIFGCKVVWDDVTDPECFTSFLQRSVRSKTGEEIILFSDLLKDNGVVVA